MGPTPQSDLSQQTLPVGIFIQNIPTIRSAAYRASSTEHSMTELPVHLFNDAPAASPASTDRGMIARQADRKSTRLNSSHLVISYAVFCLKKKKNKARADRVDLLCVVKSD